MENALLTKKDISSLLNMCPKSARIFLERNGIFPINVGNGKIPRLRWKKIDIISLLDTIQANTQRSSKQLPKLRKREADTFLDLPMNELLEKITSQRNEPLLQ